MLTLESKKELIISGLNMRKNHITTGNCLYTPQDVVNVGEKTARTHGATIRVLDTYQMRLILKIDDIIEELLK